MSAVWPPRGTHPSPGQGSAWQQRVGPGAQKHTGIGAVSPQTLHSGSAAHSVPFMCGAAAFFHPSLIPSCVSHTLHNPQLTPCSPVALGVQSSAVSSRPNPRTFSYPNRSMAPLNITPRPSTPPLPVPRQLPISSLSAEGLLWTRHLHVESWASAGCLTLSSCLSFATSLPLEPPNLELVTLELESLPERGVCRQQMPRATRARRGPPGLSYRIFLPQGWRAPASPRTLSKNRGPESCHPPTLAALLRASLRRGGAAPPVSRCRLHPSQGGNRKA